MDNATAVAYVNHFGGTKSSAFCEVALQISEWCEEGNLLVEAVYLPGSFDVVADMESRALPAAGDWRLCADIVVFIAEAWPIEIDMFAAAWNTQLRRFVSRNPQPGAEAVDAFAINWRGKRGYL